MSPEAEDQPVSFEKVIAEEYEAIGKPLPGAPDLESFYRRVHQLPPENAPKALCLSGGGIRSATFALGVMQGLAKRKLLAEFDYLSTVSGGGYIGGWLTAWINNHPAKSQGVMAELEKSSRDPGAPEPKPIQYLRAYSNYLSPRLGLFSADTWTLAGIFLRNLILNWLILVPMLIAAILVPRICVAFLESSDPSTPSFWLIMWASLLLGLGLGVLAITRLPLYLPSFQQAGSHRLKSESEFIKWHLAPLAASCVFLTTAWYYLNRAGPEEGLLPPGLWADVLGWRRGLPGFVLFGVVLHTLAWWIGARRIARPLKGYLWLVVAAAGALGGSIVWWMATGPCSALVRDRVLYVTLATPLLIALFLLAGLVFVGAASFQERIRDPDREWWARSGGWLLILAAAWVLFSSVVLYGPLGLLEIKSTIARWVVSVGGTASGVISALVGWTSKTSLANKERGKAFALVAPLAEKLLAPLFSVTLLALGSLLVSRLVAGALASPADHWRALDASVWWQLLLAAGALGLLGYGMGWIFSVNRFSLHAMYRNRLIRAYLGASRDRKPDPFTGFDPADNLLLANVTPDQKPLHILNMALNVTSGEELAWQQRKALSFTASPLRVGSFHLGYHKPERYTDEGGLSLGTAVTISGAAASPNMGYHSSKALTFLMALFNLRLGGWFPNPGLSDRRILEKGGPDSPLVLLREGLGMTNKTFRWVYLSDGGHFENLGLHEMVRRRCRWIVVSDASADPGYTLEDLANAVEKIGVDLGVPIEVVAPKPPQFQPKQKGFSKHCAILRICYSAVDGPGAQDGRILYIKPAISGNEDLDVKKYSDDHADFPQQPTSDQYFDENQFESYRRLGEQSIEQMAGDFTGKLPDFFRQVENNYVRPSAVCFLV